MKKIFAEKLKKGDTIRVVAPSRSMKVIEDQTRQIAEKCLSDLGLNLEFAKHIDECDDFRSSSIKSRVEDLHSAFSDTKVKAVISVIGGFNSNQLLSYLDWELIRTNPKIFCGFSDITALNNAIYAKTGLVNYSGPAFSTFGKLRDSDYTIGYFKKCMFNNDPINVEASARWDDRKWWKNQNDAKYFNNKGFRVVYEGEAEGTIIGGNLCTLNLLQGTEYMPSLHNSIVFIEDDYESNAVTFDRDLQSLIHQPDFSGVKGMVIGRFQVASEMTPSLIEQIIRSKKELHSMPIIYDVDFGHTDPKITFPVGGEVNIMTSKKCASITITKH
ncbi:MAG: Microcin C7 self-immunity protein MccF [bacterium ADurb.Bin212]|nr:MAG: Microcin C7 self-immunity protein MccF [bacterium ADurb.Bin212]